VLMEVLASNLLPGLNKTTKNISQDCRYRSRRSNLTSPEFESIALPLRQPRSMPELLLNPHAFRIRDS
jgi:hypothetical protein